MSYYDEREPSCVVSVLGTDYSVYMDVTSEDDAILRDCDGYCDHTSHKIVVCAQENDSDIDDYEAYRKKVMRHELIHAFLFESGLDGDSVWQVSGQVHPEQTVEWIAVQFPKILAAFEKAGAI